MVAVPCITARMPSPRRGMFVNLVVMAIVVFLYTLSVLFVAVDLIDTTPPEGWSM